MTAGQTSPFNSALETGVRTLAILVASYPKAHDLARLVQYDYLAVHSADAGGPPSLHPPLPLRSGELLVRRGLIEAGVRLMISRNLVIRRPETEGFLFSAQETAGAFLDNLRSPYMLQLQDRADWVVSRYDGFSASDLDAVVKHLFEAWTTEFQPIQVGHQMGLLP